MCSLPNCAELATIRLRRSSLVSVRPDLRREEAVAYDLASALVSGGVLPELTYQQAVDLFGEGGTAEFIYLVGLYCMVSVTLN
jgi:4-carboxymuconolactone decarboxylase